MIIEKSSINLLSSHYKENIISRNTSIKINGTVRNRPVNQTAPMNDSKKPLSGQIEPKMYDLEKNLSSSDKLKKLIVKSLIEKVFGKKFIEPKGIDPDKIKTSTYQLTDKISEAFRDINRPGFEIQINQTTYVRDYENLIIKADGYIKLSDGKEINFDLDLNLLHFYEKRDTVVVYPLGQPKDPLIISLDNLNQFNATFKFKFDLDGDGMEEEIYQFEDTGFMFLDKNNDGIVNNGTELFGTRTGRGFSELVQYDVDKNNWLDERDPVFRELAVWIKDVNGKDIIKRLSDVGIGAIYLNGVVSPFEIKDINNTRLAQIRESGLYVKNDGSLNTIHQIDFYV